jgi:hypothetical protein
MTITLLCLIALMGAFTLSATNLNAIGRDTVAHSIEHSGSVAFGGIAVVILAETAQIIFSLALALVDDLRSKSVLYSGMIASTAIALVGNIEYAKPDTYFHWFIAVIPPLVVLGLGFILKVQALHAISNRHEAKRQFQLALVEYQKATANPEMSPMFKPAYANALREMLVKINSKGRGKNERVAMMQSFTGDEWRMLVQQELSADMWFEDTRQDAPQLPYTNGNGQEVSEQVSVSNFTELATASPQPMTTSTNGNGSKNSS